MRLIQRRSKDTPVFLGRRIVGKDLKRQAIIKGERERASRSHVDLKDGELFFTLEQSGPKRIATIGALHVPLETRRHKILRRTCRVVQVAAGDTNFVALCDAPCALQMQRELADLFRITAEIMHHSAFTEREPLQVGSAAHLPQPKADQRRKDALDLLLQRTVHARRFS